ncbi:DNA-binding transcriptional MerR regulator [Amaricoccus macauensis]|uniref:DNA-binding transcriptional MerR regulator n=1 Tax=Amaricoccus macauensis TaxID=57001 RepID=A0A840SNE1_9RHOB|nr:MerR family transcriptional regulator [Amaricoccus macauensis]MBB5220821.1 DNA-binding transcriptional MerR regulator [Amaricoccus macauensis]
MLKSPEAFRTISEVAETLDVPPHVLRFWETRFAQVKPVKRGGGRRYYRPEDVRLLRGIRGLLYDDGMTIKGVQKILRERGVRHVIGLGTVGDIEDVAPVRADRPVERHVVAEVEEFEVEEFETGVRGGSPSEAGHEASTARAGEPLRDSGVVDTVPAAKPGAKPQADLFPAQDAAAPSDAGAASPADDRTALRELIGRLEALRAVMTETGR